jgi:dipeptidyl aminopeptidase/acylaminoacyl peptidase
VTRKRIDAWLALLRGLSTSPLESATRFDCAEESTKPKRQGQDPSFRAAGSARARQGHSELLSGCSQAPVPAALMLIVRRQLCGLCVLLPWWREVHALLRDDAAAVEASKVLKARTISLTLLGALAPALAESANPFDAAVAFGARPSVTELTLSPNGTSVTYTVPGEGQTSVVYTLALATRSAPQRALVVDGKAYRLDSCQWVANDRLVCGVSTYVKHPTFGVMPATRMLAVNANGSNLRELSTRNGFNSRGYNLYGGDIIDWLPDQEGAVLMTRNYLPDVSGSRTASSLDGLAVEWIDTRSLAVKHIEPPRREATDYYTDGHGTVRAMSVQTTRDRGYETGLITNLYRLRGSREWLTLNAYNTIDGSGFDLQAVDRDLNIAYGFKKQDGRKALYSITLDESRTESLLAARADVDVDDLIRIGRHRRAVGVSFALQSRQAAYFAPEFAALMTSLSKALPGQSLQVADASVDENKMLVFAGGDTDPGVYYIFDRQSRHLDTFLVARRQLEGVVLAKVKQVSYHASDGTSLPGFLTLPLGHETAKGLPALVIPLGAPSERDARGFNWLSQFYAARGFAVLQPTYRGASGYGYRWFRTNGFRSWSIAIGDVLDAGRWLVREGIADPAKLAVVGWSYGGYAALQSAVVDATVFKAVVAIAPVTDLRALKEERRYWSDFYLAGEFVGAGPHMHEGSPVENADKIKVPVLLFHGALDRTVSIDQSKHMAARLTATGTRCELVTWDNLYDQRDDSGARTELLRKSDEFLRRSLGM